MVKIMGRHIVEEVKRRLYAESMGRCMNPNCRRELFSKNGDIVEQAHIVPYCETADNSYDNLVILCPNCHTEFDKNHAFTPEEILNWKKIRKKELESFFSHKYDTFDELKKVVVPLLLDNKNIFENYYLKDNKQLWDKFEGRILANNRKLKLLFSENLNLFQPNKCDDYSNLSYVKRFIAHVDEFEITRLSEEKNREILFPPEINSMFGISPIKDSILPSTESLELLIEKLKLCGKFEALSIGIPHPFIQINDEGKSIKVFLDDTPRIRQLYYNYDCFRGANIRLQSLNHALTYINNRKIPYAFFNDKSLREIMIFGQKIIFVYEYCLSQQKIIQLSPEKNSIIVNLHNWNGDLCISEQAYKVANIMNISLFTMEEFYNYINEIQKRYL